METSQLTVKAPDADPHFNLVEALEVIDQEDTKIKQSEAWARVEDYWLNKWVEPERIVCTTCFQTHYAPECRSISRDDSLREIR